MTSKDSLLPVQKCLRIVLIGKVGAGKTAVMNSILRCSQKNEEAASQTWKGVSSETKTCQKEEIHIGEQTIVIVDTPGLCNAEKEDEEEMEVLKKAVSLADPGPHVFLFVLKLDRFTEEQDMVAMIWKTFGEVAADFAVVLFTHRGELKTKGKTIEEFFGESKDLKMFVSKCNDRFYDIDINNQDPAEATKLLQFINNVVKKNGERIYTKEMMMKNSVKWKQLSLSVSGCAFAGAGVGGVTTYLAGTTIGVPVGAAAGGVVGGVMGAAGMVAAEYIKNMKCVIQ